MRISGSNAGYTVFRGSVKSTGYLLHSPVSPSLPVPCLTVCHHISTGLYVCCGLSNSPNILFPCCTRSLAETSRFHRPVRNLRKFEGLYRTKQNSGSQSVLRGSTGIRDQFPGDPWMHFCNGCFEIYCFN